MSNALMNTYARLPVTFTHGEGVWLYDENGDAYFDALTGIAVCGLGHAHPAVTQAICDQSSKVIHTSNLYGIAKQQLLGDTLTRLARMDRVFFANSGAEANEASIKLARLYGNRRNIENPTIIVMESSFHGRTMATLSATGNRKVHAGFEPLVQGFVRVPHNDIESIQRLTDNKSIVAILVEPIQGEGGIHVPDDSYLQKLREICNEQEWLLMLDEVQCGMGRTGKMFAHQHAGITPDVMSLAKALGNGVPIGACLAHGQAAELFAPGNHGTTFGGNPLASAAALAVCETIEKDNLIERAALLGSQLLQGFKAALADTAGIKEIRGKGLMVGIELDHDCPELVKLALEEKLLINVTAGKVIRLLPPLIMTDNQAAELVEKLSQLIKRFLAQ
jgi:acetylornithine/N-succinyldiaminopimelate aminotransferase